MDRITKSLLDEFVKEQNLEALPEDKQFEHFACFLALSSHYDDTVQTEDFVTGEGSDTGIDAVATIINGALITDPDEVQDCLDQNGYLDVTFVFVQAERSTGFDAAKIGTFGFGVLDFFSEEPRMPRNAAIKDAAEIMASAYGQSSKFKPGNPACILYYVTTGTWIADPNLEARKDLVLESLRQQNLFSDVSLIPIGADGIQKLFTRSRNKIARDFSFAGRTVIGEVPVGVTEAYLGVIPANAFLDLVQDERGNLIKSIFYDNVRDFQDYNAVNTRIKETLADPNSRSRFALLNNGITVVAKKLRSTGNRLHIEDYQIVNGCQTSHVLWLNKDSLDESVMVPLRVIATDDEDITSSIIRATNSQTAVGEDQLLALSDFQKRLEAYFESFEAPRRLHYERRSRQYNGTQVEKTRIISPSALIRSYASMFLSEPHRATRNYNTVRERVGKEVFGVGQKLLPYYAAASAQYKLEFLFRNNVLDSKYKPARYHLLLAFRLLVNSGDPPRPTSNESDRYAQKIVDVLWDTALANEKFHAACAMVDAVARGNFDRDHIRTQSFTEELIRAIKEAQQSAGVSSGE
jgi:hypothetical protein